MTQPSSQTEATEEYNTQKATNTSFVVPAWHHSSGNSVGINNQDILCDRFNIEVPVIPWSIPFKPKVRVSAQQYNTPEQYNYLAKALITLLLSN